MNFANGFDPIRRKPKAQRFALSTSLFDGRWHWSGLPAAPDRPVSMLIAREASGVVLGLENPGRSLDPVNDEMIDLSEVSVHSDAQIV